MQSKEKTNYKWIIVAACFVMVFVCLGFCSSNKSIYLSAITDALGIKRSLFAVNDSCRYIATAVVNIFFGALISRFGTKKMIGFGFCSLIVSMLIYANATHIVTFYVGGCFLGIGLAFTTTSMVGCVVRRWCKEHSGKIMGAVLAANGLGGAVAAQIVSPIIYEEGNPFGFRNAYKLVALILTVVGIIIMVVFKEKSSDEPTAKARKSRGKEWTGISFAQARKKPYFYIVLFCTFLSGLVLQGINGIASAHMKDVGLDASYIATVLSAHSLALAGFKFLTGIFYDKFGGRKTMLLCSVTATVVTLALAAVAPSPTGRIIAMLYGIFSSLALPLETVMLPLMTNDLFGSADFDHLLGLLVSFSTAGYAVGNPLVNLCFDMLGTYVPILYILSAVMLVVTVCYQLVFSFASRDKDRYICEAPTT